MAAAVLAAGLAGSAVLVAPGEGGSANAGIAQGASGGGSPTHLPPAWRPRYRPWSADSPWRQALPAGPPVHPRSANMIADLFGSCGDDPNGPCKYPRLTGAPRASGRRGSFGEPIYLVGRGTPTYRVACFRYHCGAQGVSGERTGVLERVPIPRGARPDPSGDGQMVLYDPRRKLSWELWMASFDGKRWKAGSGMRWRLDGAGIDQPDEPGSSVGAGTPLMGTVIRPEEVRQALHDGTGVIPHLLSGGYDSPRSDCFVGPFAKKSDADDGREWAIPEGAVLQLDPSLSLDRLGLNPAETVIARTLQVYGMVIRDDSGAFSIGTENVSVEGRAEPGRSRLWRALGVTQDSLRPLRGDMFRVIAWDPAQAHGSNCP